MAHGQIIFLGKCILGDRGDKSDSKKYLRALDEGVMPDCWFMLAEKLTFLNVVILGFTGVDVGIFRRS